MEINLTVNVILLEPKTPFNHENIFYNRFGVEQSIIEVQIEVKTNLLIIFNSTEYYENKSIWISPKSSRIDIKTYF